MLTFKEFDSQTIKTTKGFFYLGESISHIEDLSPDEFLHSVKNIAGLVASEKLDGANLVIGFDNEGRLYTSRESKGGDRTYKETSPTRAAENGFCAAFKALNSEKVKPILRKVLSNGEAVECELLFGRQPNAVVYGSNYIAFLRMVPGDNGQHPNQGKIKQLNQELKGHSVPVELSILSTIDGSELVKKDESLTFKFTSTAFIENHEFAKVNVAKELSRFEQWLNTNPPSSFKTKKEFVEASSKFMLPIKERLVDQLLRSRKPALRDTSVSPDEDIGVEGIVMLDPKTGKQFKIVDRSIFTVINQFNHAIRNQIKATSNWNSHAYKFLYHSFEASAREGHNSLYDNMLQEIASAIGIPGVSSYMMITRTIKKYGTPEAFVRAMNPNTAQAKERVSFAIQKGINDLKATLNRFKDDNQSYKLRLKDGREIKYTGEVVKRTLIVFAETSKELHEMLVAVKVAKTNAEIANALFGKQLKAVR